MPVTMYVIYRASEREREIEHTVALLLLSFSIHGNRSPTIRIIIGNSYYLVCVCCTYIIQFLAVASHYGRPHLEKVCISLLIFYRINECTERATRQRNIHFILRMKMNHGNSAGLGWMTVEKGTQTQWKRESEYNERNKNYIQLKKCRVKISCLQPHHRSSIPPITMSQTKKELDGNRSKKKISKLFWAIIFTSTIAISVIWVRSLFSPPRVYWFCMPSLQHFG